MIKSILRKITILFFFISIIFTCNASAYAINLLSADTIPKEATSANNKMMEKKENNFTFFSVLKKEHLEEWKKYNSPKYYSHPDFGITQPDAPCPTCVEVLEKRTIDSKYFINYEKPSEFFIQKAIGEFFHQDNNEWVNIDDKLKPVSSGLYQSNYYLEPVGIDVNNKHSYILTDKGKVFFNNWHLFSETNGTETLLDDANWSNYTVGDDGIYIKNIFKGIDAQLIVYRGAVKTNFVMKKNEYGEFTTLIFRDTYESDKHTAIRYFDDSTKTKGEGALLVYSGDQTVLQVKEAVMYPQGASKDKGQLASYKLNGNNADILVPYTWINQYINEYELIIDPLVSGSATLAQALILGSRYNASCTFAASCNYNLTVAAPANATFSDVLWSFTYVAVTGSLCWLEDGACRFTTGGCTSPSAAGYYWFCNATGAGTCAGTNVSIWSDLAACMPGPTCSAQNIPFTMQFFRSCWGAAGCSSTCIGAASPWTMTIKGNTLEYSDIVSPITISANTICQGESVTVSTLGNYGVPGYTYNWSLFAGGAPSAGAGSSVSINFPTNGAYTIYCFITDACGNTITSSVPLTVNPSPITTVNSPSICAGETATLTAAGATSYSWSTGAITNPISVTPATTTSYTVTGTSLGCTSTAVSTVTVNPIPVTTVNSTTICAGGTATLTGAGATSYTWSTGDVTNPITVTPATTTSYTVTGNSLGCTSTAVSTVTVNPSPITTVNSTTICAGETATLTAAGATSYAWSTGDVTNPITVTPATTTSYTVTGTSGTCTSTAVATVTVSPLAAPIVNSPSICAGASATLTAAGAASYAWSTGAITNSISVTPATTTSYTVTGTTGSCTSTAVATVTVNPIPVTTVNSTSICPGGTATLTAAGATSYAWSTGDLTNPISVSPAATTSYTVTGTSLGCSSTAVATVTMNALLVVDAGADDSICYGMTANLAVTPNGAGYVYAWTPAATLSGGGTIFNPTASPSATTTYSVTVTDPSGCTGTDAVTIFADPQITIAIAGIDVTCNGACNGQTIVIPGGGTTAYTYNWSSGCTAAACNSLCPGTYSVTVTDAWGCNVTSSTSVAEPTVLTASVTASTPTTCNALCDGTATAAGAGGTIGPGYSYSWNTSPVQTTPTATGLCAGTYTCTITDANFCTATATVTITQPTVVVTAPIAAVAICNGGTATLTAAASGGNTGGYTYLWAPAGTGTTAAVTVTPATTTTYTVTASDSLHACPAAPVTVTVTVNPPITVIANGTTSICPGVSTAISATASLGTGGPYTYTWAPAAVGTGSPVNVSPAGTTTYTVTANDGCSPPATATVTVTVLPLPVVNFTANVTSGCAPLCVNFSDNSTVTGGTINTWAWTFDGVTANTANPSHCFTTPGSYTVTLTVTSSLGDCTSSSTQTNMITVYPNPVASFTAPQSASIVDPVINFTDNSSNATAWNWNFGDPQATSDSVSSLQNPSHSYPEVGNYCVTLTVTSANGCTDVTQNCLTIDGEFTFFIPNAFSPNGDGINDEFFGKGNFIHTFEMKIFDRWGNLIFYADDITKHWDGKANKGTQIVQEDVYVYTVVIRDNKENIHKFIGTVTIAK